MAASLLRLRDAPSGDDIGRQLILKIGDAILQRELVLLQALHLKLESGSLAFKRGNPRVKLAVLAAQPLKLGRQYRAFFSIQIECHHRPGTIRIAPTCGTLCEEMVAPQGFFEQLWTG